LAFWIEDTSAVHLLWRRAVMLFGGMLVPIDLLPDWLAQVCRHLPFSAMLYAPARCFAAFDPMVATSACWTLTLTLAIAITAVLVLYHAACRNLTTNGG
jgi:ABC-2 type transport system permease protein